jgi:hypothetical protein
MWAKNLLPHAVQEMGSPGELQEYDFECSSAYGLLWSMARTRLPREIIGDLKRFVDKTGDVAKFTMDANRSTTFWGMSLPTPFTSHDSEKTAFFQFSETEMSPPQGIMALNYARFSHNEQNAHKWCIAWNTHRSGSKHGGNFFVADYGLRVENSTDMVFAWQGEILHGTSLPDSPPDELESNFLQRGLGFAMSRQLGQLLQDHYSGTKAVPMDFGNGPEYMAEAVLDSLLLDGEELFYFIKWRGDPDATWHDAETVNNLTLIDQFHAANPTKPGPLEKLV